MPISSGTPLPSRSGPSPYSVGVAAPAAAVAGLLIVGVDADLVRYSVAVEVGAVAVLVGDAVPVAVGRCRRGLLLGHRGLCGRVLEVAGVAELQGAHLLRLRTR